MSFKKKLPREKYLIVEEYQRLLSVIKDARDYVMFYLCGNLGLRAGELVRLRWQDIHWDEKFISVPTLKQKKKEGQKKGTIQRGQLPERYEDLPSSDDMLTVLKNYYRIKEDDVWLFPHPDGLHIHKISVQRKFKKYVKLAKLNPKYSIHSLRHFRGKLAYETLQDLYSVSKLMRHSHWTTSITYSNLDTEGKRKFAQRIPDIKGDLKKKK